VIPALVHHLRQGGVGVWQGQLSRSRRRDGASNPYPWLGNVRELQNELRRIVALAEPDAVLRPDALSLQILRTAPTNNGTNGRALAVPCDRRRT
jgi:DNA-binding NtrC family response regulator